MRDVIFLAFLVTIECCNTNLKKLQVIKMPLEDNQMLHIVELASHIERFQDEISKRYNGLNFEVSEGAIKTNMPNEFEDMQIFYSLFVDASFRYVMMYLTKYCCVVIKFIEQLSVTDISEETIDLIQIKTEKIYCFASFFFGVPSVHGTKPMIQLMLILQSLSNVDRNLFSIKDLAEELLKFVKYGLHGNKRFDDYYINGHFPSSVNGLKKYIAKIKNRITEFTVIFCPSTVLFIDKDVFENNNGTHHSYVSHIFNKEMCIIQVSVVYFNSSSFSLRLSIFFKRVKILKNILVC